MRIDRWLIAALLFIGSGVWLILAWCHGTVGFNFAYPFDGTKLAFDVTSVGFPVIVGIPLVALGLLFMLIALLAALIAQFHSADSTAPRSREPEFTRLNIPFES
jgi:hypothetical protein